MCTGFVFKGKDTLYGFNLDIDETVWDYKLYKKADYFTVGIKVGTTTYFTHGVNADGHFANLPYMNGDDVCVSNNKPKERLDLLVDRYIRNKYSFKDIKDILNNRCIVSPKGGSFHSLFVDGRKDPVLIEPGYGIKHIKDKHAVITNFPILKDISDYNNPFYGKDRYDIVNKTLKKANDSFDVTKALKLLNTVKQEGKWGTKISFVYSSKENGVYYFLNGDMSKVNYHQLNKKVA